MGLTRFIKQQFFNIYICCFSISIHSSDTSTSALRKQTGVIWNFYFRFRFWTFYHRRHVIMHQSNKFYQNWTITNRVMTLCRFSKMAAICRPYHRKSTFAVWFYHVSHLGRQRTICKSTAEILLLPVTENKRPPYLNSTPYFDFDIIFILQDGGHSIANLLLDSGLATSGI